MNTTNSAGRESLAAGELRTLIQARVEIAVIDVREEVPFSKAHLLISACLPLSRLETMCARGLPRLGLPICCVDHDEGLAERAVTRLRDLGYTNVTRLEGGVAAWRDAGFPLYSGVHVPSKAFAEVVEHHCGTDSIDADELHALQTNGKPLLIVDGRSREEYLSNSIPGAFGVPNGELVLRIHDLLPREDALVVVNCGGRTRSIIGAQTLVDLGLPKVAALRNGTMAWHLANLPILTDQDRPLPRVTSQSRQVALAAAGKLADHYKVTTIDEAIFTRWSAEAADRALFLLDVRTSEEYALGHLPGAVSAPGGQLLQETEVFVPVFQARIVLTDDGRSGRAAVIAAWIIRMGWGEVAVLPPSPQAMVEVGGGTTLARGIAAIEESETDLLLPVRAAENVKAGTHLIVDVASSKSHRAGHIPGAIFAVRSRLMEKLPRLRNDAALILTSEDGVLARFAAAELRRSGHSAVAITGGTEGWRKAGLPIEAGMREAIDDADDVWYAPRHRDGDREAAMKEYLTWEVALADQVRDDRDVPFNLDPQHS